MLIWTLGLMALLGYLKDDFINNPTGIFCVGVADSIHFVGLENCHRRPILRSGC